MLNSQTFFIADRTSFDVMDGAYVVGLANGNGENGYLMLQRSTKDSDGVDGIYIELNDQVYSGYKLIKDCQISRMSVTINLLRPLAGVHVMQVQLAIADESFNKFIEGIKIIFQNQQAQLTIL